MKRTGNLKHDEAKLRAWEQRSRAAALNRAAAAAGTPRRAPLRRSAPKRRQPVPLATRRAVAARSGGRCVVCGYKPRRGERNRRGMHRHHVLPVRTWPALELEADNMVLTCDPCHDRHESAFRRIRRDELPACALVLAARVGSVAVEYMDRTYPSDGGPSRAAPGAHAKGA